MDKLSLYVHWPFCKSKCPYCDFNSHVVDSVDAQQWLTAYKKELDHYRELLPPPQEISTIYFGGGTPSLMPKATLEGILEHIDKHWKVSTDIEITLEANPTSSSANLFKSLRNSGVNRLSIGIQALNDKDLTFLGREHNSKEARETLENAAKHFDNYSFDLIYARPEQSIENWENELLDAFKYTSKHLSLYQLTIEKGTPFYKLYKEQAFELPDEDSAARMYELTEEILEDKAFYNYEISNYAKKGYESQHNLNYWRYNDYLGIGPGAHSRLSLDNSKYALTALYEPKKWLNSAIYKENAQQQKIKLTKEETMEEFVLMGLRTTEGVDRERFSTLFGQDILNIVQKNNVNTLKEEKLIEINKSRISTTKAGKLLLNKIIQYFFVK
jgi:oxygen-independent coproporphyrinogen-3 oxidase